MKMDNGTNRQKKKSGGFIKNTFIIQKEDSSQKKMGKVLAIVSLVLILAAIVLGALIIRNYANRQKPLAPVSTSSQDTSSDDVSEDDVSSQEDKKDENGILMELSEYYNKNDETVGRVYIPDTKLNYIVAKRKDNDDGLGNAYYLDHTLEGKDNPYGTPFANWNTLIENGIQSTNVVLYGHNSHIGEYFEAVKSYKDIDFYKEHPIINFDTIYEKAQYKILGVFTEDVVNRPFFNYHEYINFSPNEKDKEDNDLAESIFNKFVDNIDKRNYYDSGIDLEFGDSFVTLSTCNDEIMGATNTKYRDVLVARRVRPGEDETVDTQNIKENEDMIMPQGWIDKFGKENPYK